MEDTRAKVLHDEETSLVKPEDLVRESLQIIQTSRYLRYLRRVSHYWTYMKSEVHLYQHPVRPEHHTCHCKRQVAKEMSKEEGLDSDKGENEATGETERGKRKRKGKG